MAKEWMTEWISELKHLYCPLVVGSSDETSLSYYLSSGVDQC